MRRNRQGLASTGETERPPGIAGRLAAVSRVRQIREARADATSLVARGRSYAKKCRVWRLEKLEIVTEIHQVGLNIGQGTGEIFRHLGAVGIGTVLEVDLVGTTPVFGGFRR